MPGQAQQPVGLVTSGAAQPKLFADKENNCGVVSIQNASKLTTKSGINLRQSTATDNVTMHQRPRSNLDGAVNPEN